MAQGTVSETILGDKGFVEWVRERLGGPGKDGGKKARVSPGIRVRD
jgi:hypothetical protein